MKAFVTGAGGFLGLALAKRLRQRGDTVIGFARGDYPELGKLGIDYHRGDLADADRLETVLSQSKPDVVFHVAAKPGVWGPEQDYVRANFLGTKHIVDICNRMAISRLVFTSSPSVVFAGGDMAGVDESVPYPDHYETAYPRTKAEAERLVLSANGPNLATVALRPHLIWGPGDNHLVPRLLARGRSGQLRQVGPGENVVDTTYIDNAVEAHVLAGDRLLANAPIGGRAFFISDDQPIRLWEMVNRILAAGGVPPVRKKVSVGFAYFAGVSLETVYRTFGWQSEPRMTRFLARELATSHWFDITAAKRDLGYHPIVSLDEGLRRLSEWLAQNPNGAVG